MNALLLMLAWLTPLALLPLMRAGFRSWLTPLAALPALAAALLIPPGTVVEVPWLLLGAQLGLDAGARAFLLFGSVLWLIAGLYAIFYLQRDKHAARFFRFFLLAMSGNFGLIVGQDLVSFYLGFGLMGLAAYGLVVHDGNETVRSAGRVYLVMTLIGELALFAGFLLLYERTGTLTPMPAQIAAGVGWVELALLLSAFGIKAGLIGVHFWLPLAHPAAPVPASAVLSGAMIKTALIGWMRYLPLGASSLPELSAFLILAGLATAVLAIPLGLGQRDPKVVLAYSSIGKMGLMIAGLGVAAADPVIAPAVIAAITFYAAHHGLAKGALFLGVGVVKARSGAWPLWILVLPALVLVGAPFTSGAVAKAMYKETLVAVPPMWDTLFGVVLPLTAVGTLLLMARFIYLMWRAAGSAHAMGDGAIFSWGALVVLSLGLSLLHGSAEFVLSDAVTTLVIIAMAWGVMVTRPRWLVLCVGRVPPGDVIEPFMSMARLFRGGDRNAAHREDSERIGKLELGLSEGVSLLVSRLQLAESALRRRGVSAVIWLSVIAVLFLGAVSWG